MSRSLLDGLAAFRKSICFRSGKRPRNHPGRLLETSTSEADIESEVRWVGHHQNSTAIEGWIEGLLARPRGQNDPWLVAIGEEADVRCP